ncbi:beta-lactamase/transpeptidase-like protein [Athelia psychrophila]|uniref:Beta-lactamase/transpeptidase-like protein n=1 Tax=Athelia psychrophila TaxID=1759441 RepID=A0A166NKY2_9AGAM|nr:beta-lactamase/transpeptidase-like protein [Fibularhizoctonia sp. CBS 109695]
MSSNTLDEIFHTVTENKFIPGAVLVATNKSGTLNYAKAFGRTGVSPDAKPLTLDSTFWLASCSKLFTTIAALQCAERGLFSLDSPADIVRLLPELAAPNILTGFDAEGKPITVPAKNRITLRQLLAHTAGMSYEFTNPLLSAWRKTPEGSRTYDDAFLSKYLMPLVYEPGELWMYSGGVDWAGKLVERANGGMALEAYMQQYMWDPLGMQDITFHLEKKARVKQRLVEMTARVPESGVVILETGENTFAPEVVSFASGGGGLWGSAPEFLKVLTSILRDDGRLLGSETVAEMFKPQLSPPCKDNWMKLLKTSAGNAAYTGNAPMGMEFTGGLGGFSSLEDMPGRRKKGSLAWGGLPNLFWWIDPEGGVAGLYASQMTPSGDKISTDLFEAFEKDVYTAHAAIGTIANMAGIVDHLLNNEAAPIPRLDKTGFYECAAARGPDSGHFRDHIRLIQVTM